MVGLMSVCCVSLSLVLLSFAGLLRLLPRFLAFIHLVLRCFLILSYRLYHLLLARTAPAIQQRLGFDVLVGHWRLVACLTLSLCLGLLFLVLTGLPVTGWGVGLSLLHGLAVGLAWDEIQAPGGLQLGVKIQ
jgi:hypothetical protein